MTTVEFPAGVDSVPVMGLHFMREPLAARDYVQDGLIVHLDAIENIAYGVSDHADMRLVNLAGDPRFNLTLSAATAFGDNYITSASSPMAYNDNTYASGFVTVEVVFTPTTSRTGVSLLYAGQRGYSSNNSHLMVSCKQDLAVMQMNGYSPLRSFAVFDSAPQYGGRTYTLTNEIANRDTGKAYCNARQLEIQTGTMYGYAYTEGGRFGGNFAGSDGKPCYNWLMHAVRAYSRALTAAEIAANCAIDRERFNLP